MLMVFAYRHGRSESALAVSVKSIALEDERRGAEDGGIDIEHEVSRSRKGGDFRAVF